MVELTIKTTCPSCGKKKAITKKVVFVPPEKVCVFTKSGCHKCKWSPHNTHKE